MIEKISAESSQKCVDCMFSAAYSVGLPNIGLAYKMPGLPNFSYASFYSFYLGINYSLKYLPPDPLALPSLPTLDYFLKPFTMNLDLAYKPSFGLEFPFPPTPPKLKAFELAAGFDISGAINLLLAMVLTIFGVFKFIIQSIIDLNPKIPTIEVIVGIFMKAGLDVGIPPLTLKGLGFCWVKVINDMLKLLPV